MYLFLMTFKKNVINFIKNINFIIITLDSSRVICNSICLNRYYSKKILGFKIK